MKKVSIEKFKLPIDGKFKSEDWNPIVIGKVKKKGFDTVVVEMECIKLGKRGETDDDLTKIKEIIRVNPIFYKLSKKIKRRVAIELLSWIFNELG